MKCFKYNLSGGISLFLLFEQNLKKRRMIPVQVKVNENGSLQYYLEEGDLQKLGFIKRDELNHLIKPTKTEVVHEALSLNEAMKILKKGFAKIKAMINAGVLLTTPDGRILKSSIDDYFTGDLNVYKKKK